MKKLLAWLLLLTAAPMLRAQAPRSSGRSSQPSQSARSTRACGVERWRVKILADDDRGRVRWATVPTSIAALREIHSPRGQRYPPARRIAPYELRVYHVHAIVRQILTESDGDWHLVLGDSADPLETLVAEIPDSACALGSGHEADYAAARRALRAVPRGGLVDLVGVGFFDYLHGQRGMAPNGFELHPVVAIRPIDYEGDVPASGRLGGASSAAPLVPVPGARGAPESTTQADTSTFANVRVWLNTNSMVYHCAGTRWYGNTRYGEYVRQAEAVAQGARPAYGRRCGR